MVAKTLEQLAKKVNAKIKGDPKCIISGVAALQNASTGQISFLDNQKYRRYLSDTKASAVILSEAFLDLCKTNALIVDNPYFAYAKIAEEFLNFPKLELGIHKTAIIGKNCKIDKTARIGAHVVIADDVAIGANTEIWQGCVIGKDCKIGHDCALMPNVTLYHGVKLANRIVIHSGAVLGACGFGFAKNNDRWYKVPQLGGVVICDDVEIGANTTIDRGALNDTFIGIGVKLDNQIQVGHNVVIGDHTVIAGCVGISGSTKIGKHCLIGGGAGIGGHIEIADHVVVTGMAMITNSITKSGLYSSGTGLMENNKWKKNVVRFRNLDRFIKRLQLIEKNKENFND